MFWLFERKHLKDYSRQMSKAKMTYHWCSEAYTPHANRPMTYKWLYRFQIDHRYSCSLFLFFRIFCVNCNNIKDKSCSLALDVRYFSFHPSTQQPMFEPWPLCNWGGQLTNSKPNARIDTFTFKSYIDPKRVCVH